MLRLVTRTFLSSRKMILVSPTAWGATPSAGGKRWESPKTQNGSAFRGLPFAFCGLPPGTGGPAWEREARSSSAGVRGVLHRRVLLTKSHQSSDVSPDALAGAWPQGDAHW